MELKNYRITLWDGRVFYHTAKNIYSMIYIADRLYQCDYSIEDDL